jgi:redox-sensing transcriptional repressor
MLPDRVIERLIVYRRLLKSWGAQKRDRIYSHELAALAGVTPAQVRRDIMAVQYVGSPAKGYDVEELRTKINELLDDPEGRNTALVGVGHLGQALMAYFNRGVSPLRISAAFDVDPERVSRVLHGCHCYPLESLEAILAEHHIAVAILAVPETVAQEVADRLVMAGVCGILNFTPTHLNVPEHVHVEDVDIAISLEKVAFFARSSRDKKGAAAWPQSNLTS